MGFLNCPPNIDRHIEFNKTGINFDKIVGYHFGDCIEQPASSYITGNRVSAKFVSGHLRNNLMLESSFLTVERQEGDTWVTVARDAEWETRMGE